MAPLAAASAQSGGQAGLTVEECRLLLQRSATGGADYVPGVNATGQPVAPADLPPDPGVPADGGPSHAFDEVEIKLLGPLVPLGDTGLVSELRPGTLKVNTRTGAVTLDGKPLTGNDSSAIASYCAALEKRARR